MQIRLGTNSTRVVASAQTTIGQHFRASHVILPASGVTTLRRPRCRLLCTSIVHFHSRTILSASRVRRRSRLSVGRNCDYLAICLSYGILAAEISRASPVLFRSGPRCDRQPLPDASAPRNLPALQRQDHPTNGMVFPRVRDSDPLGWTVGSERRISCPSPRVFPGASHSST
jgi:hypothetical protein